MSETSSSVNTYKKNKKKLSIQGQLDQTFSCIWFVRLSTFLGLIVLEIDKRLHCFSFYQTTHKSNRNFFTFAIPL